VKDCMIDECRKVFLELSLYWKSALIGGIVLLGMIMGLWTWSYAEYRAAEQVQNEKIAEFEKFQNDLTYLRSDANKILDNQRMIIENQKELAVWVKGRAR
jgi:DNA-binding transcriptional regulator/RsmH inhibitor MraZ